jgi:hypothetical protein
MYLEVPEYVGGECAFDTCGMPSWNKVLNECLKAVTALNISLTANQFYSDFNIYYEVYIYFF